jgi:hypothetical protein
MPRVPFNRNERVRIAKVRIVINADHLLFLGSETPYLVALHVLNGNVDDQATQNGFAFLASKHEQATDRIAVQIGDALDGPNTGTFDEQLKSENGFLHRNCHAAKRLCMILRVCLAALRATESLQSVPVFAKSAAFDLALETGQ